MLLLLVMLLVFGPKRLPEMGRSLGRGMREFKESVTGEDKDDDDGPGRRSSRLLPRHAGRDDDAARERARLSPQCSRNAAPSAAAPPRGQRHSRRAPRRTSSAPDRLVDRGGDCLRDHLRVSQADHRGALPPSRGQGAPDDRGGGRLHDRVQRLALRSICGRAPDAALSVLVVPGACLRRARPEDGRPPRGGRDGALRGRHGLRVLRRPARRDPVPHRLRPRRLQQPGASEGLHLVRLPHDPGRRAPLRAPVFILGLVRLEAC